jgi:hypothetical protein
MKKIQKLGLALKYLQIADALARVAEKLYALWNMTNNYHRSNEPQVVFKV